MAVTDKEMDTLIREVKLLQENVLELIGIMKNLQHTSIDHQRLIEFLMHEKYNMQRKLN